MTLTGLNKNVVVLQIKNRIFLLLDDMQKAVIRVVNENNNVLNEEIDSIRDNIFTIIQTSTINTALEDLFAAYDLVGSDARTRYLLNRELFAFAEGETNIVDNPDLTTALNIINLGVQLNNIALAYDNAADIEYKNSNDLDEVISDIDTEFSRIVANTLIDTDSRVALINLNTSVLDVFASLDLSTITNVTTTQMSSQVLSYTYYGTTAQADQIIELNGINNTGFIDGDVSILSAQ